MMIVHIFPSDFAEARNRFSASQLQKHCGQFTPLGRSSGNGGFNVDGYFVSDVENKEVIAYTQAFRDGSLEAVLADISFNQHNPSPTPSKILKDLWCERALMELGRQYAAFREDVQAGSSCWVFVALANCKDIKLDPMYFHRCPSLRTSVAHLPEHHVDNLGSDPQLKLRPVFDYLANAVGASASRHYDEAGVRREKEN